MLAQNRLIGVTSSDNTLELGGIYSTNMQGDSLKTLHSFSHFDGRKSKYAQLCLANNGKLYGHTSQNSYFGYGAIYEYSPNDSCYNRIYIFEDSTGSYPYGNIIQASNGLLYGTTTLGGKNGDGVIYSFDINTLQYTAIFHFEHNITGSEPEVGLFEASNGKLYGAASRGGNTSTSGGTLFELDPANNQLTILKHLHSTNGEPYAIRGSLTEPNMGVLYGMSAGGGTNNNGCIYKYNIAQDSLEIIHSFNDVVTGKAPRGHLVKGNNGYLWGLTEYGGILDAGTLFKFDTNTNTLTKKLDFDFSIGIGGKPRGSLFLASNGKLYSSTFYGGINPTSAPSNKGRGILFSFDPITDSFNKLVDCYYSPGFITEYPNGTFIELPNGELIAPGHMSIYQHNIPNNYTRDMVYLSTNKEGYSPYTALTQAGDRLYGLNLNNLYSINPDVPKVTVHKTLTQAVGKLTKINNKLYGVTRSGGNFGRGFLYEYDYGIDSLRPLQHFQYPGSNIAGRNTTPLNGNNGKIYGAIANGYGNSCGFFYEYDIALDTLIEKFQFFPIGSCSCLGDLLLANNGKIYGVTTKNSLFSTSTIYEYDITTNTPTKKITFPSTIGNYPISGLMQASNNKLYGITGDGGTNSIGAIYMYDIASNTANLVHSFDSATGYIIPSGTNDGLLLENETGKLIGGTNGGGLYDKGVLFTFDINTQQYTIKHHFKNELESASFSLTKFICDTRDTLNITQCDTFHSPSGNYHWSATGVYSDTIPNYKGCDSIFTVNLTINQPNNQVSQSGIILSANQGGATYQWLDCQNSYQPIAGETNQTFTPTTNGSFAVRIDNNSCIDTSNCVPITTIGIEELIKENITIYPNPSHGKITIENLGKNQLESIRVRNLLGEEIPFRSIIYNNKQTTFKIKEANGTYILEINLKSGYQLYYKILLINN